MGYINNNKEFILNNRDRLFPNIEKSSSILLSIFLSIFFVVVLYFRNVVTNRNDPIVIKKRLRRVLFSTIFSLVVLYLLIPNSNNKFTIFLEIIGIPLNFRDLINSFGPLFLTIILFFGPVVMALTDEDDDTFKIYFNFESLRDYIVGPLVEEVVFRSVICPILFFAGFKIRPIIILSPFLFGFAHMHHMFPLNNKKLLVTLIKTIIQICFTSLFGMFSAFLFFRTGNILSCFIVHAFCNIMGLPNFGGISYHKYKQVIGICFIIGLLGFAVLVLPLTNPEYYESLYNVIEPW
ncbi:hypothetical protein DICPUDRAFT_147553 [Dictyostelium purpureum]|uniref:intramembrane prenyl-peptidase Rce1 n=1 Tax=Dictyostelium purpureum TaxID=5786 RepID=F0Z8S9_DICPU|nr:uncharacterized protein DICPUDRAFT_147553 [Dictyostelium purpureum]EGC39626.1 hypothetical protein DICPUDRAFT_147553 [Dictyostelium purpureum]|eukprot:XP_003283847.1 hypothetical protein DICPUDRAFT_147553 [Dictyostelium purpureum]